MIAEEDWVPISALQHFSYCPRQCALIHVEQVFEENIFTQRGRVVHKLVDTPESRREHGVRVERALPLYSQNHGLSGKADLVEFNSDGVAYPVEYKHGAKRENLHDDIQLAAQALCLEEMTGQAVSQGAIFHYSSRRRRSVRIDNKLRSIVTKLIPEVRAMLASTKLPLPVNDSRCRNCSLADLCQPKLIAASRQLSRELASLYEVAEDS